MTLFLLLVYLIGLPAGQRCARSTFTSGQKSMFTKKPGASDTIPPYPRAYNFEFFTRPHDHFHSHNLFFPWFFWKMAALVLVTF